MRLRSILRVRWKNVFLMINYFGLCIPFCQSAYQYLSPGNLTVPSINWVSAQLWLIYLLTCVQKSLIKRTGEKLMENTHSATNNRLFSLPLFPLAPFLYSNHLKGKTAKTVPSRASRATAAGTPRPPRTAPRCCPTTLPLRRRPPTSRTLLGRKSQIRSKSGPSPGACMKADVSMKQV